MNYLLSFVCVLLVPALATRGGGGGGGQSKSHNDPAATKGRRSDGANQRSTSKSLHALFIFYL